MIRKLGIEPGQLVLDPFCGTGTTLVECMKRGVGSVGVDASPFSCFISRVKTNRAINALKLLSAIPDVKHEFESARGDFQITATYRYLHESGMLKRGWISKQPLRDALALRAAIKKVAPSRTIRDVLLIALIADLSRKIANMKYGPEIYKGRTRRYVDVWAIFQKNVLQILRDLEKLEDRRLGQTRVLSGDARNCGSVLRSNGIRRVHAAISSPPYPTEHDYTRNTRLELAFLDFVATKDCVRDIKQDMIRSHTKGIYKSDMDGRRVSDYRSIRNLANLVEAECADKSYGFARLYPTVIKEYFGGMKKHFESMSTLMSPGAKYAVVVGDQSSYFNIRIPTAELLGEVAEDSGFDVEDIVLWRERWASKTSKMIKEHALILKRTKKMP
jgi:DNA modification methylase